MRDSGADASLRLKACDRLGVAGTPGARYQGAGCVLETASGQDVGMSEGRIGIQPVAELLGAAAGLIGVAEIFNPCRMYGGSLVRRVSWAHASTLAARQ